MNEEQSTTIYCSRCGAEMKSNSRYCMKCGNLNYDHEDNEDFKKFQPKEEQQIYQIGSGSNVFNSDDLEKQKIQISINKNNNRICFLVNYISYIVVTLISLLICFKKVYTLDSILYSSFPAVLVTISVFFLYFYALQLLFVKSDRKWWEALIPIYNCMVLGDIVFHKKYIGLLLLIPVVGSIFSIFLLYRLGKRFKYNGILTVFFPFIMILFIGFGIHNYEGRAYIDYDDKKSIERHYKYRKVFLGTDLLILFAGVLMFVFSDIDTVRQRIPFFGDDYYIYVADKAIDLTKNNIEKGIVDCSGSTFAMGEYYFNYNDIGDYTSLLFYNFHNPMQVSVLVNKTPDEVKYYVALTDGKKGFSYTVESELSSEIVTRSTEIALKDDALECQITR